MTSRSTLQSLARGLAVMAELGSPEQPRTLSEVADACGVPRAVARRLLRSLEAMGYATSQNRLWALTPRALILADAYLASSVLPTVALGPMLELSRMTRLSTSLAVRDGREAVYVQRIPGKRIVHAILHVGTRIPLHASSLGRVLLAGETDEGIAALLGEGPFDSLTTLTRTTLGDVLAAVQQVREAGYCLVRGEFEPDLLTLAVPVHDADGRVVAALNLPSAVHEFDESGLGRKVEALTATAAQISAAHAERVTRRPA